MRQSALLVGVLALILIAGGFLTIQIIANGPQGTLPGLRVQTLNPEASTLATTTSQAVIFLLFAGFTLGSLVAIGFGLAFIFRYVDKQVQKSKKSE